MTAKLAALLADRPDFTGAACRGQWLLFDPAGEDEDHDDTDARHQRAATICRGCPVLAACRGWADQLPARARPPGVLAGQIPHPAKGRPRKASA